MEVVKTKIFPFKKTLFSLIILYPIYRINTEYQRNKFMRKIRNRNKKTIADFENFTQDFDLEENFKLKNIKNNEIITKKQLINNYSFIYYGKFNIFYKIRREIFKKFSKDDFDILYLIDNEKIKKQIQNNDLILDLEKTTVAEYMCNSEQIPLENILKKETLYLLNPLFELIHSEEINENNCNLDFFRIKLNKEIEQKFLNSLKFNI